MLNTVLPKEQKSRLKKGPSFVPTPRDINWYKVRKDFTKFSNKIRHLADLDQQESVLPQVNSNEPTVNENNFPPGKSPKVNPYQQLYRSKPSTKNTIESSRVLKNNFLTPIILKKLETNSIKKKN